MIVVARGVALAVAVFVAPRASGAEPYVDWLDGLCTAAQALAAGDGVGSEAAAARARSGRPSGTAAQRAGLARGLALRAARRPEEAAGELERAWSSVPPLLATAVRLEWADAALAAGSSEVAAALFAAATRDASRPLARRARRGEAEAVLTAGRPRHAVEHYELLLADAPASEVGAIRLAIAGGWRAAGDGARSAASYRALWLDLPAEAAGREAGRVLAAWRRAGGPVPAPTPEEQLQRAERLVLQAHPRRALQAIERLPATLTAPDRARAALLRALASLPLGRSADAAAAARCADVADAAAGTRVGARLVLARTAARAGRLDEARGRYAELSKGRPVEIPGISAAAARGLPAEAGYLSAWLLFDAGRYAEAAIALHRYAEQRPSSPRALDARWFEAWSLRRLGQTAAARRAFARLERTGLAPGALYWGARLAPRPAARTLYRRAIAAEPGGWYALLAVSRLAVIGERVPALVPLAASPLGDGAPEGPAGESLERATALLAVGLRGDALAELRSVARSAAGPVAASLVAQLASAAGDAELPFLVARDQLGLTTRTIRWAFPAAFEDRMPVLAARAGIDPGLFAALVRRESSFRPDARSPAGAVGLVQLLPQTAERLATLLGVATGTSRALTDPATSLAIGAAYLGLLQDRFPDHATVLFAYNGGPSAAAGWARARTRRPLDEAVEEIPYRESRRYVKTVLASRAAYEWLYGGAPLAIDGARRLRAHGRGVDF